MRQATCSSDAPKCGAREQMCGAREPKSGAREPTCRAREATCRIAAPKCGACRAKCGARAPKRVIPQALSPGRRRLDTPSRPGQSTARCETAARFACPAPLILVSVNGGIRMKVSRHLAMGVGALCVAAAQAGTDAAPRV